MRSSTARRTLLIAALVCTAMAQRASGHEKWFFAGDRPPSRLRDVTSLPVLAALAVATVVTGGALLVWKRFGHKDVIPGPEQLGATPDRRADFYALVPLILAIHLAVPLLVCGARGQLFSPNNVPPGAWRYFLGVAQIGVALAFFYGGLTRLASLLLAVVWLIGFFVCGAEPMLENIHYLGFAGFFFVAGRGPISIDRMLFPRLEPSMPLTDWAMPALRTGMGLSLIFVAFTEKLANLDLARAFLHQHPVNFTAALGIGMSDTTFIICAGCVELIVGLMLLVGAFPRATILIAWFPFNITISVFGWAEVIGHLPFYGAMAVLLIWTPQQTDASLWREGVLRRFLPARAPLAADL